MKNLRTQGALSMCALLLAACGGGTGNETTQEAGPAAVARPSTPTTRLIVKLQSGAPSRQAEMLSAEIAKMLSQRAGVELKPVRVGALGAQVLELPQAVTEAEAQLMAARLHGAPGVAYAEPDAHATITAIPDDPSFSSQWSLVEPEKVRAGINAVGAWDLTRGSGNVVVAVLDTGVLPHTDLLARLVPGYDFVSDLRAANDSTARDSDATDPGDWITSAEASSFGRTSAASSSWHGTHVAGIIAATANNKFGVSGVAPGVRILPVRVLGKGGGTGSDIADGIVWAAGGSVPGVPSNPNPAKVINLSLGGAGTCTQTYQDAINFARSRGATVVVAAGNEAALASTSRPANCAGVVSVAAVSKSGGLASYSNYGSAVTLAAPGGDQGDLILSLGDQGTRSPLRDQSLVYSAGTSMAAPAVSGVAALMLSVNPALTPTQVQSVLTSTVSRFPSATGSDCNTSRCGTGILNALSAVRAAAAGEVGSTLAAPQSGWWWNENEGGRGYALEFRNGALFMAGFMYELNGKAMWFVSSGEMSDPTTYAGGMERYEGGQTLDGAFKKSAYKGVFGTLRLKFSSANRGLLTWPDGSTTALRRYDIVDRSASLPQNGFAPEAGWWWNADEPGRGFALEVQGDNMFIGGFMYDAAGQPVWYVAGGRMSSSARYSGEWLAYTNGQAIGQPYKRPDLSPKSAGPLSLTFSDTRNATLTLPGGRQLPITRYLGYGTQTPINPDPPQLSMVNLALGSWSFTYRIVSSFTDTFQFESTFESSSSPGTFYAYGLNQYDELTVVGYDMEDKRYYMLSKHADWATFDSFYTFALDASGRNASGCYYLYYRSPPKLTDCFDMTGFKTANSGTRSELQVDPQRLDRWQALLETKMLEAATSQANAGALRRALQAGTSSDERRQKQAERLLQLAR